MPCDSFHPALLFKANGWMDEEAMELLMKKALQIMKRMRVHITDNVEQQIKNSYPRRPN